MSVTGPALIDLAAEPPPPPRSPSSSSERGLSYFGMDSTYASSLAILRRILRLEGALD